MIPEFGNFALILALVMAMFLAVVPMAGTFTGRIMWMNAARSLAAGMFVFTAIAFVILAYSFLQDDFSVKYVANHSNTLLPDRYKISAVWGGHEGSLLLWVLTLCTWTLAVSIFSRDLPVDLLARVLSVLGMIAVGFYLFMIMTSNPFDRNLPGIPQEGSDLNPLLQDFGLIIHPPMLYMGYVGFSVAFAFAIAALIGGRLDSAWARWSRPWTNMAWAFLTVGIALGSWWAYYELGWGGWWFWDPVENASFMPWLVGTALIHSLAVTEKRGVFKSWTILLAIFAFSLSLLGTFIVRSGVLTSVHAFATDPTRGLFILIFLGFVVGGSLLLYALRVPVIRSVPGFTWMSREAFLLFNNVLFVVSTAMVLFGTLYPLLVEFIWDEKLSVGPPFFDIFFVPLMAFVAALMGVGMLMNWKKTNMSRLVPWLLAPLVGAIILGLITPALGDGYRWSAAITVTLGAWIVLMTVSDVLRKTRNSKNRVAALFGFQLSYYGMLTAHIGFMFCLMGASLNTIYSDQRDLRLEYGKPVSVGGHEFELTEVVGVTGPNYQAKRGEFKVFKDGKLQAVLHPENRNYVSGGNMMTEAAIDAGFMRDLYVALGDELDARAWSVRVHYKPFVRWIWLGALLMGFGGALAVFDKRYRRVKAKNTVVANTVAA
ncbi:heme lyase CcmF/NrfE family subunit [Marinagarivorans algicola]|uniref:heme lyase CcmF/NrfE family subunit n=1 Tax=Marinagarivorans algicola TaxID=1513270 RepID=UPI0006B48017|nr:heme lyase CcmF/NrfE family subunit [Marinagarivorans algicola]